MTGRPIGVALAAFGSAARVFHIPLLRATPGLELRTIVTRRPDEVRAALPEVMAVRDFAEACADPAIDLVVIPTPNDTHAPLAAQALQAGKHVVVDKPFTLTVAEAESLLALAAAKGRVLSVFQNRRWDADFLALRQVLASGAVGEPVLLESRFDRFRPEVPDRWRDRPGPGSGLWYDLGPHLVDQALQLFGPPARHLPRPRRPARRRHHRRPLPRPAALRPPARHPPRHHARRRRDPPLRPPRHARQLGEVRHRPQEAALKAGALPGGPGWGIDPRPGTLTTAAGSEPLPGPPGDYGAYYRAIRDAIRGTGPNPVTPAEALAVMTVLELGRASDEQRRELAVPTARLKRLRGL